MRRFKFFAALLLLLNLYNDQAFSTVYNISDEEYIKAIGDDFKHFQYNIHDLMTGTAEFPVVENSGVASLLEEIQNRHIPAQNLNKDSLRILSIDGGGIRGIIPLYFLAKLEENTGKRAYEMFDVIAGTSTGGMIALALSIAPAKDVLDLYLKHGTEIFLRSRKLFGPKYSSKNRRSIFRDFFGNHKLSEAKVPTIVTAWEFEKDRAYHFYSTWPNGNIFSHEHLDMLMSDAALATSAAPTYFEPEKVHPIRVDGMRSKQSYTFLDGGVFANNPSMIALNYAMTLYPDMNNSKVSMLSLGTGYRRFTFNSKWSKIWPKLFWASPLFHILLTGNSTSIHDDLNNVLKTNYDRVTTHLVHAASQMDRVGRNLDNLMLDAKYMVEENARVLQKWVDMAK